MSDSYTPTWITPKLAVGHAPMSYDDLESLKNKGIDAILNLCGEYCDLHDIEHDYGFDVYYLPIPDESIPDTRDLEKALAWLDEAIYLGKSVLVHCRFGIGRTGTLVTAYLLRRGLGLKSAAKLLKQSQANPSTYGQHKLLKKYGRKEKPLTIRQPSLENRHVVDLGSYFREYESIVARIEAQAGLTDDGTSPVRRCGRGSTVCCYDQVNLTLVEAIYLGYRINRHLNGEDRLEAIQRALALSKVTNAKRQSDPNRKAPIVRWQGESEPAPCPLSHENCCLIYDYRPLSCRLHGTAPPNIDGRTPAKILQRLSNKVFYLYSGFFMPEPPLSFSLIDTVSGRFVQAYFYCLADLTTQKPD
jgi:protein-tyrosine phosphatase/Fe-S-cluster containining protein